MTMMRKAWVVFSVIMLCFSSTSAFAVVTIGSDIDDNILSMCYVNDDLFLLGHNGIYRQSKESVDDNLWIDFTSFPTISINHIFTNGYDLMGLDATHGYIYLLQSQSITAFVDIPWEKSYIDTPEEDIPCDVLQAFYIDTTIFMLWGPRDRDWTEGNTMVSYNIQDGHWEEYKIDNLKAIFPCSSEKVGILVCNNDSKYQLMLLSLKNNNSSISIVDSQESAIGAVCYSAKTQEVFFCSDYQIFKATLDGLIEHVGYIPYDYIPAIVPTDVSINGMYSVVYDEVLLTQNAHVDGKNVETITVLGSLDQHVCSIVMAKNPAINVQRIDNAEALDSKAVINSFLAKDDDIDIYVINSQYGFYNLVSKGYTAPMNTNEELVELANSLYPVVKSVLFDGDNLVGFPINISINSWAVNETLWLDFFDETYPETYAELFELMDKWYSEVAPGQDIFTFTDRCCSPIGFLYTMIREYIIINEMPNKPINFDTLEFNRLLELIIEYEERDAIANVDWDHEYEYMPLVYTQFIDYGISNNDGNKYVMISPPKLSKDQQAQTYASMDVFVVNPNSKNKEAALQFIVDYAQNSDVKTRYSISNTDNAPVRSNSDIEYILQLETSLERLENALSVGYEDANAKSIADEIDEVAKQLDAARSNAWYISSASIANFQSVASTIVIPTESLLLGESTEDIYSLMIDKVALYRGGQISKQELISQLTKMGNMAFLESN